MASQQAPVLHPVVQSFPDVFAELPPGLPPCLGVAVSSACDSLLNAQRCMSRDADQARRDELLSVGEYVLLSSKFLRLFHVGGKGC